MFEKYYLLTIIPVYNGESYIEKTLESIRSQITCPDHVIISDGCSSDSTLDIVSSFDTHGRFSIQIIKSKYKRGFTEDMNFALSLGEGITKFLHILNADDIILPNFYNTTINLLESIKGRSMAICTSIDTIDSNGCILTKVKSNKTKILDTSKFRKNQCLLPKVYPSFILLKLDGLSIYPRYNSNYKQINDQLFFAEFSIFCDRIVKIGEKGMGQYRIHPMSYTSNNKKDIQSWVIDEIELMNKISNLRHLNRIIKWIESHKLKYVFAARSQVKMQEILDLSYARLIEFVTKERVSPIHWWLAKIAVTIRNLCFQ